VDFLSSLFDTSGFTPRRFCGQWSAELIWLHRTSDLLIWLAYLAIPAVLIYFVRRRRQDLPFRSVFWMFGLFIVSCGFTHFMEVLIFDWPAYRLAGALKLVTALVSWATVLMLVPLVPQALALSTPTAIEREVVERRQAEEKFRGLLEAMPDAMLIVKEDGEIVLVNSRTMWLFGYTRAELLGQRADMLVPQRFRSQLPTAKRSGYFTRPGIRPRPAEPVLFALRKDGTEFPVEVSLRPLQTDEGTLYTSLIRDVSERKRAEEAQARYTVELAQSREVVGRQKAMLQSILDNMSDGVAVADEHGEFLLFNPAAETILGKGITQGGPAEWSREYGA
jgi:PAS domain S-box-containing protein